MKTFSLLKSKYRHGFTLIELLLVIGIIAILASIVIVAINPTKQLGDARDAQRRSDVNAVLNAVYQYSIDNNGAMPGGVGAVITAVPKEICQQGAGTPAANLATCITNGAVAGAGGSVFLEVDLTTNAKYLGAIPTDPKPDTDVTHYTGLTSYTISQDATGRVTVTARDPEGDNAISITR